SNCPGAATAQRRSGREELPHVQAPPPGVLNFTEGSSIAYYLKNNLMAKLEFVHHLLRPRDKTPLKTRVVRHS
ncbi:unnamed protein product, partial [Rangifer tarandus platyrhynchus]